MEDLQEGSKIFKKGITLSLNLVLLFILLYVQNLRYDNLINLKIDDNHEEVLRKIGLMQANGNDMNWILGLTLLLTILNIVLYKNWIKAKRWVLEPIIIFIFSLGLTLTYHINRTFKVSEQIDATTNFK
jgi:hypothetical protein